MKSTKKKAVEAVYHECLKIEFERQNIPFKSQTQLMLSYKGKQLKQKFTPDFLLFAKIIVELKPAKELNDEHRAQVHNDLRATEFRPGLLVNFGHFPNVQYERIVL